MRPWTVLTFLSALMLACGDDGGGASTPMDAGPTDTDQDVGNDVPRDVAADTSPDAGEDSEDTSPDVEQDVAPRCGDGLCNGDEVCDECADDCGQCDGLYVIEGEWLDAESTAVVETEHPLMAEASGGAAARLAQTNAIYTPRAFAGPANLCFRVAGEGDNPQFRVGSATVVVKQPDQWTWVCVDYHAVARTQPIVLRWWNHQPLIDKIVMSQGGGTPEGLGPDAPETCGDAVCQVHEEGSCADCDPAMCGDGLCQPTEDCGSCSDDCGACSSTYTGLCRVPAQLASLPAGYWCMVPNSNADAVEKRAEDWDDFDGSGSASYDSYQRVVGFRAIIGAWGGGALDSARNRLVLFGGGHNDYGGNELVAFDLTTLSWLRLTEPTAFPNRAPDTINPDGTPLSRHTYGGLAYIAHADRYFALSGAPDNGPGTCNAPGTWTFDFGALEAAGAYDPSQWELRSGDGEPSTGCEQSAIYDPGTERVLFRAGGGWFAYDFDDDMWTQLNTDGRASVPTLVIAGRTLVEVGGETDGVITWDLDSPTLERTDLATTGAKDMESVGNPGAAYDPTGDRVIAWAGGSTVYSLDLASGVWTAHPVAADNAADPGPVGASGGTYGRFRYSADLNAYVTVDSTRENVFLYRFSP